MAHAIGPTTGTRRGRRAGRARRASPSASTWPAPTAGSASRSRPPATSRSTRPTAPAPPASGLGTRFEVDPELVVPDPGALDRGGRHRAVGGRPQRLLHRASCAGLAEIGGFSVGHAWRRLRAKDKKLVLYGSGGKPVHIQYRNRFGRRRSYTAQFEGVVPWLTRRHADAESDWSREQIEQYMREVDCPDCGGRAAQARVAGGDRRRHEHLRAVLAVDRPGRRGGRRPRPHRARPHDRRPGPEGGPRADAVPARRRPRVPLARPLGRRRCRAARPSGSGWPARSAAGWSACSTCSTSRRSGCTSGTTSG